MQRSDIAQQKVARLLIEVFRCKVLRLWQFVRNNRLWADEFYRYVTGIVLPVSKCFSMSKTPPLNDKQLLVRKSYRQAQLRLRFLKQRKEFFILHIKPLRRAKASVHSAFSLIIIMTYCGNKYSCFTSLVLQWNFHVFCIQGNFCAKRCKRISAFLQCRKCL